LSPHFDDAVFSLGATIARATRSGAQVTVLTVFAGDPRSRVTAGPWDHEAGFRTEGEAAAARRREDARACAILSARPVWQPFPDEQYADALDDAVLIEALEEEVGNADTLLVPGFPLIHADHLRLAALVLEAGFFPGTIRLYVEQPYALWEDGLGVPARLGEAAVAVDWQGARFGYRDTVLKMLACRSYKSQLGLMPHPVVWPMSRYEVVSTPVASLETV
jgi:LmbE family N-acetylglucosaminyl deacetylase